MSTVREIWQSQSRWSRRQKIKQTTYILRYSRPCGTFPYMILYPTETVYALGVHALDEGELAKLYELKGRDAQKAVSWLVRDVEDVKQYAEWGEMPAKIAERFLPGPLTLVLPLKEEVRTKYPFLPETAGFRISSDPYAQQLIAEFMEQHHAPLTCTSANISGMETQSTPALICAQFGEKAQMIDVIIDGGTREGFTSTVIQIIGTDFFFLREGAISKEVLTAL